MTCRHKISRKLPLINIACNSLAFERCKNDLNILNIAQERTSKIECHLQMSSSSAERRKSVKRSQSDTKVSHELKFVPLQGKLSCIRKHTNV